MWYCKSNYTSVKETTKDGLYNCLSSLWGPGTGWRAHAEPDGVPIWGNEAGIRSASRLKLLDESLSRRAVQRRAWEWVLSVCPECRSDQLEHRGNCPEACKNPVKGWETWAHMGPVPTSMTAQTLAFTGDGIWSFCSLNSGENFTLNETPHYSHLPKLKSKTWNDQTISKEVNSFPEQIEDYL